MVAQNDVPTHPRQVSTEKTQIVRGMIGAAIASIIAIVAVASLTLWDMSRGNVYGMEQFLAHALLALGVGAGIAALLRNMGDHASRVVGGLGGALAGYVLLHIYMGADGIFSGNPNAVFQGQAFDSALQGSVAGIFLSGVMAACLAFFCARPSVKLSLIGMFTALFGSYPIAFLYTLIGFLPAIGIKYQGARYGLQAALFSPITVTMLGTFWGGFIVLAILGAFAGLRALRISKDSTRSQVVRAIVFALIGDAILIAFVAVLLRNRA